MKESPEDDERRCGATSGEVAPETKVLIVGAGLAGSRCAQLLVQAGTNVTVFEARDRIGGRVRQENLGGRLIDMGPNWVHGTESSPIVRLASQTKAKISSLGEESVCFGSNDKPVDEGSKERLGEVIWDINGETFAFSNKSCAEIPPELSLRD